MEKIIKIDILNETNLLEKYDNDIINRELIEYVIKQANYVQIVDRLKIEINNKCKTKIDVVEKLIEGLKKEYDNTIQQHYYNNIIQLVLLALGIIVLFLSTLLNENSIWREIILIIGWVPIWEMVDLELFKDFRGRRRKKIIQKLLNSEIIEIK